MIDGLSCKILSLILTSSFQVMSPKEVMNEWQKRPQILISRFIRKRLAQHGQLGKLHSGSIKSPRRFKLVQQESEAHE
jgi:uridine phosphorylase